MGSLCAVFGDLEDVGLQRELDRMLGCSSYRGRASFELDNGFAVGIQTLHADASLTRTESLIVALHGFVGNWRELDTSWNLRFDAKESDSDKLVIAWNRLGKAVFGQLRGEFSALVYDRWSRSAVIARDAVGLRPLFFEGAASGNIYVATEIRQVLAGSGSAAKLDAAMVAFESMGCKPPMDRTLYENVRRFAPGAIQHLDREPVIRVGPPERYWDPQPESRYSPIDELALAEELRHKLNSAISRTIPAAPEKVAVALSGGIDSSAIWAQVNSDLAVAGLDPERCVAYSLVFPGEPEDETDHIRSNLEAFGRAGHLLDAAGLPISTGEHRVPSRPNGVFRAGLLHIELSHLAYRQDGISIEINGFGGDEWLRGDLQYMARLALQGHPLIALSDVFNYLFRGGTVKVLWGQCLRPTIASLVHEVRPRRKMAVPAWVHSRLRDEVRATIERTSGTASRRDDDRSNPTLRSMLRGLNCGVIADPTEQAAAVYGVEHRHPFMDRDLIDFAFATHGRWHIRGGRTKNLLRLASARSMPAGVNQRKSKTVFDAAHCREGARLAQVENPRVWISTQARIFDLDFVDKLQAQAKMGSTVATMRLARLFDCEFFARRALNARRHDGTPQDGEPGSDVSS